MICIVGSPRSASHWLLHIIRELFDNQKIQYKIREEINKVLKDNQYIKMGYGASHIVHIVNANKDMVEIQLSKEVVNEYGNVVLNFKNVWVEIDKIANIAILWHTHKNIKEIINSDIDKYIKYYFTIHRNVLDEVASIVRLYGLSEQNVNKALNGEKINDTIFGIADNPKNFWIKSNDLKKSFLDKAYILDEIRSLAIENIFHKCHPKVHEFYFEDLTKNSEKIIAYIIKILNLRINDLKETIQKILLKKETNATGFSGKKKNINYADVFFDKVVYERYKKFFYDILFLTKYESSMDFFKESDNITRVICIDGLYEIELKLLNNILNAYDIEKIDFNSICKLEIVNNENYIFLVNSYESYNRVKSFFNFSNCKVYPYHEALFGYKEILFDLTNKNEYDYSSRDSNIAIVKIGDNIFEHQFVQNIIKIFSKENKKFRYYKPFLKDSIPFLTSFNIFKNEDMNIYIFGAGKEGQSFLEKIKEFKNIKVLGFVDSFKGGTEFQGYPVIDVNELLKKQYDKIIIASHYYLKMIEELNKQSITDYYVYPKEFSEETIDFKNLISLKKDLKNNIDVVFIVTNHPKILKVLTKKINQYDKSVKIIASMPLYEFKKKSLNSLKLIG